MKWAQEFGPGSWTAWSGEHRIGFVQEVRGCEKPTVSWQLHGVSGSKYQKATHGECGSVKGAKKALRRGWRIWLKERGLVEVKP